MQCIGNELFGGILGRANFLAHGLHTLNQIERSLRIQRSDSRVDGTNFRSAALICTLHFFDTIQ
jgi:hypothetical protein